MKQWLIFSGVAIVFLLVWGTVIYQIFIMEEPEVNDANDLPLAIREQNRVELKTDSNTVNKIDEEILLTKKFTEKNNESKPQIDKGLDFGAGISVDDLLESYGLNNNSED